MALGLVSTGDLASGSHQLRCDCLLPQAEVTCLSKFAPYSAAERAKQLSVDTAKTRVLALTAAVLPLGVQTVDS